MTTKKTALASAPVPPQEDELAAARRRRAQLETKIILRVREAIELGYIPNQKTFERNRKAGVYDEGIVQLGPNSIGLVHDWLRRRMGLAAA